MHISIAGKLGSGKSTISKVLKANHGFQVYSTGAIQRGIALRHNVSTLEMNQLMAQDVSYDYAIDDEVKRISVERGGETIVFDSRMAWRFAEKSFKVFVTVDPLVAASRVMGNQRGEVEVYSDLEDARAKLNERSRLENERFIDIYGVDNSDYSNYNLVIDSTRMSPDELAYIIYGKFQSHCKSGVESHDILLSPESLYPLSGVGDMDTETLRVYMERREYSQRFAVAAAFEGYHYIAEGRHRVLAAILNSESLINVLAADRGDLIPEIRVAGISSVYDFEEVGKFRYKSYPAYYYEE